VQVLGRRVSGGSARGQSARPTRRTDRVCRLRLRGISLCEVDTSHEERVKRIVETLEVLRRAHPRNNPSVADIVALHELHARHERSEGRDESADAAEERARRASRPRL